MTHINFNRTHFSRRPKSKVVQQPLRLKTIAALIAGVVACAPHTTFAADGRSVAEIQAEVARLKDLLEKEQQSLAQASSKGDAASSAPTAQTAKPAQEEAQALGAVVVRGAKLIDLAHDVPTSTSVVSAADLNRDLSQDYSSFARRAANITFNQSNTRGASLSVRGIGKRGFAEVQDPSVLTTLDGVSFGLTAVGNFDFYDIDSVETARGLQGFTGGKGASAGAVNITSKRPSFTPSNDFSVTFGQRDSLLAQAGFGGPIVDGLLAWRGALSINKQGGYYTQDYDPNYSFYNKARVAGRTQFLLTPSSDFSVRVSVDVNPHAPQLENGLTFRHDQPVNYANGTPTDPAGTTAKAKFLGFTQYTAAGVPTGKVFGPRDWFSNKTFNGKVYNYYGDYVPAPGSDFAPIAFNENQGQTVSTKGASTEVLWDVGAVTLSSLTAWRRYTFDAHNDEGTHYDISKNGGGSVFYSQLSQEFKVTSKPGGVLDYQAGLYLLKTKDDVASRTGWGSDAGAWFASAAQYDLLDTSAGVNRGAGRAILRDVLADAFRRGDTYVDTKTAAIFGQVDWHLDDKTTITSGLRFAHENRSATDQVLWTNDGAGGVFNPVAVRGYNLKGFDASGAGVLTVNNSAAQLSLADSIANRYYGAAITANPGDAYNSLTAAQKAQVGAARSIRQAQIGQLVQPITSTYKDNLVGFSLSPNYKWNDDITVYATVQYGQKSGTGFNVNGASANVAAETTKGIESGLKTFWLDKTLTLNGDVYLADIVNYQQAVRTIDPFQTNLNLLNGQVLPGALAYTSTQGNVPKIRIHGAEFDAAYSGITNLNLRLSGAYNIARYKEFTNSPKPVELSYLPGQFYDLSGQRLPSAPRWTFNFSADYNQPVFDSFNFHTSTNAAYTSETNTDDTNSIYGRIGGYVITDFTIGLGKRNNSYDVSLVVKNLFDRRPHEEAWTSYEPYPYPRWAGVKFTGHF